MEIYVLNLVKDKKTRKTVGADILVGSSRKRVTIQDLIKALSSNKYYTLYNAILTKDGVLRGKPGVNLKSVTLNRNPSAVEQRDMAQFKRITSQESITVYHGSKENNLVPKFGAGKMNNDYGRGFYTTADKELAKEWAYAGYTNYLGKIGYLHTFKDVDLRGLDILNFTELDSMHWLAELLSHRELNNSNGIAKHAMDRRVSFINSEFKVDTSKSDIIIGYRADDSYFLVAQAFVEGTISKEAMEIAFRRGDLGLQIFFKSKKSFSVLNQAEHIVDTIDFKYKNKFEKRDKAARISFDSLSNLEKQVRDSHFITEWIK